MLTVSYISIFTGATFCKAIKCKIIEIRCVENTTSF
jgi:hypothetical protein